MWVVTQSAALHNPDNRHQRHSLMIQRPAATTLHGECLALRPSSSALTIVAQVDRAPTCRPPSAWDRAASWMVPCVWSGRLAGQSGPYPWVDSISARSRILPAPRLLPRITSREGGQLLLVVPDPSQFTWLFLVKQAGAAITCLTK
jgi:hypothetical protein